MTSERKQPTCSHCLEVGHTKASALCPRKGMAAAVPPEKDPPSGRWTVEKEEQLLKYVSEGPLKPDWEKIAVQLDQGVIGCTRKYNDLRTPEQQVRDCIARLSDSDIKGCISDKRTKCQTCSAILFMPLMEWRGINECPKCHSSHKEEIDEIWATINPHTICLYCERDQTIGIPLHYDHLNMFEKEDSICSMVHRGDPVEGIISEIKKCQVLCKSCHVIVTQIENILGFRRLKTILTRESNGTTKGGDIMDEKELAERRSIYAKLYADTFSRLYPIIMMIIRGEMI